MRDVRATYTRGVTCQRFLAAPLASLAIAAAWQAPPEPAVAVPAARRAERVAVLPIQGPIDGITVRSLERRLERARADGVDAVVLELDTPGGEVSALLDICRLVKNDMPPNTVAWVRPSAYSAGAIIALAAREIVVTPDAAFGASAPIAAIPLLGIVELPATERAKLESPLLSEVIDSARRNHWDERLAQAFVALGVELWLLEDVRTGERVIVDRTEYRAIFGQDPPDLMTSAGVPVTADRKPVRPFFSDLFPVSPRERPERAMSPESQKALIEFEQSLPPARSMLGAADRDRLRLVTQIDAADRLLTVRAGEALGYGLAREVIPDDESLRAFFGASTVRRYDESWSEGLVRFLVSLPVRLILIGVMVICFLVELAVPGFGVFGITSLACLVVLIGAPALVGLAQWWQLALVGVGVLLVVLELLVFPGTIVIGLLGAALVLVGIAGSFVQSELNTAAGQRELVVAIGGTIGAVTLSAIVGGTILRKLGGPRLLRRAILSAEVGGAGSGVAAAVDVGVLPPAELPPVGARGVSYTALRPAGRGEFDGRLYDVRCLEGFLERGRPIRVVRASSAELEVESDAG
ncbi:MAG: hypothetical protein FJ253_02330 [Phycisphaerae bacterium]|nr:hypothetical protein [Phycisphaerae bacterium]